MKFSRNQIIIIGLAFLVIVTLVFLVVKYVRPKAGGGAEVKLTAWGVDGSTVFQNIIGTYTAAHSGTSVNYRQIDESVYEQTLLNALAAGTGPDVFEITNRELPRQQDKLTAVDASQFDIVKLRDLYPYAVEQDFVSASGSQIYALPLYLDTLALIYNRDLFDGAGIVSPPQTWDDFLSIVPQLKSVNSAGGITRAAAALGGSEKTVGAATDILELLMIQNGAHMVDPKINQAAFSSEYGLAAFNFYLQFANVASRYYTWNDSQANSVDSFVGGKTAMIVDYSGAMADIKRRSPFLNFAVASAPQVKGTAVAVNFPMYRGLAVSKLSQAMGPAWDFVIYMATNYDAVTAYMNGTGRPPALRTFIAANLNDQNFGVFAKQALTARSWYQADDEKIRDIMNNAIQSVLIGEADSGRALSRARDQVTALMSQGR